MHCKKNTNICTDQILSHSGINITHCTVLIYVLYKNVLFKTPPQWLYWHCEIEPERNHSRDLRGVCTHGRWNQISSTEIICFKLKPWTEFTGLNQCSPCWTMGSYRRVFTTKTKLFIQISECQSLNYGCKRKSFVSVTSLVNANLTKVWMS